MKILITESSLPDLSPRAWYSLPDSALANAGKPLYLPELDSRFEAMPVAALRISKLGKSVAAKFAPRYYSHIVCGVHFRASDLRRELLERGLPDGQATGFDRSLITAAPADTPTFFQSLPLRMLKNGEEAAIWTHPDPETLANRALETMSRTDIVKMGDLLVPWHPDPVEVRIGDTLELADTRGLLLRIEIR